MLTRMEKRLLGLLRRHAGTPVTHAMIHTYLRGSERPEPSPGERCSTSVMISNLRATFPEEKIYTIHGTGYMMRGKGGGHAAD